MRTSRMVTLGLLLNPQGHRCPSEEGYKFESESWRQQWDACWDPRCLGWHRGSWSWGISWSLWNVAATYGYIYNHEQILQLYPDERLFFKKKVSFVAIPASVSLKTKTWIWDCTTAILLPANCPRQRTTAPCQFLVLPYIQAGARAS